MPWQIQPLIWPLLIATLIVIPRPAHPQSAALIKACYRAVAKQCHAQAQAKTRDGTFIDYRRTMGECVKENFALLPLRCRELIEAEFSKELRQ